MDPKPITSDAELLRAVLEGRVEADDGRVEALLARNPEWRSLLVAADDAGAGPNLEELRAQALPEDRRLVQECLAAARSTVGRAPAREIRRARRAPVLLALLGLAAAAVALVLWITHPQPAHGPGTLLGPTGPLACRGPLESTAEFDSFSWSYAADLDPKGTFQLTVWALGEDGARGAKLLEQRTRRETLAIAPETRSAWPEAILWRVEVLDASGLPGATCESRARRSH